MLKNIGAWCKKIFVKTLDSELRGFSRPINVATILDPLSFSQLSTRYIKYLKYNYSFHFYMHVDMAKIGFTLQRPLP